MNKQKIFDYNFQENINELNFYVNSTNIDAFKGVLNKNNNNILLTGPLKSGKSFLGSLWIKKNNSIKYSHNNFDYIINNYNNVFVDDIDKNINEEKLFHIINHCLLNKLKILLTSNLNINQINYKLSDLSSRIKTFIFFKINKPDDDMLLNILTKLFIEKQFIINSHEIFSYILKHANRSYDDMFKIVDKLDTLSLEKKRQLTIPLIKEIL